MSHQSKSGKEIDVDWLIYLIRNLLSITLKNNYVPIMKP